MKMVCREGTTLFVDQCCNKFLAIISEQLLGTKKIYIYIKALLIKNKHLWIKLIYLDYGGNHLSVSPVGTFSFRTCLKYNENGKLVPFPFVIEFGLHIEIE